LERLIDVPHTPKIQREILTTEGEGDPVILMTSVGLPVMPVETTNRVSGRHLGQLVDVIAASHCLGGLGAGLCHRDLKPDNLFLVRDEEGKLQLLVSDWGAAVFQDFDHPKEFPWIGTRAYSSPPVSISGSHSPTRATDLTLLIRTAFVLVTVIKPPSKDSEKHWGRVTAQGTFWGHLLSLAEPFQQSSREVPTDYSEIRRLLVRLMGELD
jgi:serine/threonine protein kinase